MQFEAPIERLITETDEFKRFAVEMDYLAEFFSSLSELVFDNGHTITYFSFNKHFELNTGLIDSASQTLKSIKYCCSIGSFSDANTLTRKLRDDLLQYVYLIQIIQLRKPFDDASIKAFNINDPEEFERAFLNLRYNQKLTDDEEAVTAWFENRVADLKGAIKKKLAFENYMAALKQDEKISEILSHYKLMEYWEDLRKKLNNYVHNNGAFFSLQNYISASDKNLGKHLMSISYRTSFISSFFLAILLMVDSSLISSTDYIDYLDCGMKPPENSQYAVAPFVQEFIDHKVVILHPELKQFLKEHNIHGMKME